MKKPINILALIIGLLINGGSAFAGKVTVSTAQTAAVNFFKVTAPNSTGRNEITATLKFTKSEADNTVDFYVFDISPKGFVIISADDQVKPVIAYSLESNFATDTKGRGVKDWMDRAATHIYQGIQRHTVANAQISNQWSAYLQGAKPVSAKSMGSTVAPLLKTNWDQEPFYNQLCPFNSTDNQRTLTGCAATAMAQIMKFWNYPAQGTGSYSYNCAPPTCPHNYGNQSANFGATTYNWANMPNSIDTNNLDVATLMYHCGVSMAMGYGDENQGGSGAYVINSQTSSWRLTAQKAYANNFGYNPNTLQGVKESDYSSSAWVNLMEQELNAGRPIQYLGVDTMNGGHTWVCDGYDENDMLHMNWGWSGLDNGYYSVSALTADGYNFSSKEAALIGIEPFSDLAVTTNTSYVTVCKGTGTTLSAQASSPNVNYLWTPATGLSCANCANTIATPDTTTTYTVIIDSAGLSASAQVTVAVSANIAISSVSTTNVNCFGGSNGMAKVNVSGGNGGYTYLWNNGSRNAKADNLIAGNYAVTVSNSNGCSASANAIITQPDALLANISVANNACSLNNAFLSVNVQGGTPNYVYSWSNGQQDSTVLSLTEGTYALTVFDAVNCSTTSSIMINKPDTLAVSISSSNITCSLLYGTATANVTGGETNFSFAWSNGETSSSITNLTAGSYTITVVNSLGCSASNFISFAQPDSMNASIATSNVANNQVYGKAATKVTGGAPQFSYLWSTGDTTETITYNTPGTYAVTITDSKGCRANALTEVIDSTTTSLGSVNQDPSFEIYPNPATTNIKVQLGSNRGENAVLEVRSITGQILFATNTLSPEIQIDLSAFSNGVYLMVLTQGETHIVKQFVVAK